ncbi:MAG: Rid family hydrolase [Planctomycetales bacterium]
MKSEMLPIVALAVAVASVWSIPAAPAQEPRKLPHMQAIALESGADLSAAVVVESAPLQYTAQFFPLDSRGLIVGGAHPAAQLEAILKSLDQSGLGTDWRQRTAKINIYVVDATVAEVVRPVLAKAFAGPVPPAVSFVAGKLAKPGALVALDLVLAAPERSETLSRVRTPGATGTARCDQAATLPAGRRLYISGQAEAAPSMAEATRLTLESLRKTLEHLGRSLDDVVQVKSFLGPISQFEEAERELVQFFGERGAPPLVFVEWSSNLPIEIELVAAAGPFEPQVGEPVEYITPPGMTASPVFCRVTRVNVPESILVAGLYGRSQNDGAAETLEIFESLDQVLRKAGSDLKYLAKATYYVSTDDASQKLNEIRPKFYDPQRPPAASKAVVAGTGRAGKTLTLDMLAVRKPASTR